MKNKSIILSAAVAVLALNIAVAPNADAAVKLEVPKSIVNLWQKIKLQNAQAEENGGTLSAPRVAPSNPPAGDTNNQRPPQGDPDQNLNNPPMMDRTNENSKKYPDPDHLNGDKNNQTYPDPDHLNGDNNRDQSYPNPDHQNVMPDPGADQKDLRTFKKGAKQMNGMLNNFQQQIKGTQRNGAFPPKIQSKMEEAKGLIDKIQDANSTSELGNDTVDQLQGVMGDLQQSGEQAIAETKRLAGMKKEMGGLEKNIANFQKQLDKLARQGISAPSNVSDNLAQIKTILDAIKNAQSMDDAQSAGMENMGELMSNLNDSRQQLEMLSRWPQTSKQIDKQLKTFDRSLSKDRNLVDKLAKQGVDISDTYQKLADGLAQMKAVRDQAADKIKSGDADGAYDLLQNDLFDKTDDLREQQSIFDTLSNLGRFNSDFKRETSNSKRTLARLSKDGQDISDLNNQLAEINQKGEELSAALKVKPIDIESVSNQLEELSGLRQDFQNAIQELSPDNSPKPWEQGRDQFQDLKVSKNLSNLLDSNSQR